MVCLLCRLISLACTARRRRRKKKGVLKVRFKGIFPFWRAHGVQLFAFFPGAPFFIFSRRAYGAPFLLHFSLGAPAAHYFSTMFCLCKHHQVTKWGPVGSGDQMGSDFWSSKFVGGLGVGNPPKKSWQKIVGPLGV